MSSPPNPNVRGARGILFLALLLAAAIVGVPPAAADHNHHHHNHVACLGELAIAHYTPEGFIRKVVSCLPDPYAA